MKEYFAIFYVAYPYYFPHFLPIYLELKRRGYKTLFVLSDEQNSDLMQKIAKDNGLDFTFGKERLFELSSNFVFFANPFKRAVELKAKTIFLEHGIGTKSNAFYPVVEYIDLYLVDGSYKYERIKELYPDYEYKLKMVGYSKFDSILNLKESDRDRLYERYNLDRTKKTILYAPTYYPSSILKMSKNFPDDFKECNILIKAHYLTYERKQYKKYLKRLNYWDNFENCRVVGVEEYDLIPLMTISDVMISDESSAMFEFASLNKPVISNRYFTLRFYYHFMPWRLKRRIDEGKDRYREILYNAFGYDDTLRFTKEALREPEKLQYLRVKFSKEICGEIDGNVSKRVVDLLESECV